MSMKGLFGRGLASLLRAHQQEKDRVSESISASPDMGRLFNHGSPVIVAFKIGNGFVVRAFDYDIGGIGEFHYCKDHVEIAEHIVASEAKRKMGLDPQLQLFPQAEHKSLKAQVTPRNAPGMVFHRSI